MAAKTVKHTYTYRPKMGDVVIFPNGVEFNYSEADETVVVLHPDKDKRVTISRSTGDNLLLIGVRQVTP